MQTEGQEALQVEYGVTRATVFSEMKGVKLGFIAIMSERTRLKGTWLRCNMRGPGKERSGSNAEPSSGRSEAQGMGGRR